MSGFTGEWLALREPYDLRARNKSVLEAIASSFRGKEKVSIVDLACGTGSTFRALTRHLPARQSWRLIDNDLSLLARAKPAPLADGVKVETVPADIARDLESALDGTIDLVTTSAFFDLVSADWLDRLIVECGARRLPLYVALTYDGRASCEPKDESDDKIIAAVNLHQRGDKGFGPSLGPAAAGEAILRLQRLNCAIAQGQSDWVIAPSAQDMQNEILAGWALAAKETGKVSGTAAANWLARRRDHVAAGRSTLRVGHVDFFARPPAAH